MCLFTVFSILILTLEFNRRKNNLTDRYQAIQTKAVDKEGLCFINENRMFIIQRNINTYTIDI